MNDVRRFSKLGVAIAVGIIALPAVAQTYRAQVRGLVTDQSNSILPGAAVTLSNVNTGLNTEKQTDASGLYVFDYVDPGTYRITVDAAGFGKFLQENIVVQSGGDITVNASLHPGTLQQSVTVAETRLLSSSTPATRN